MRGVGVVGDDPAEVEYGREIFRSGDAGRLLLRGNVLCGINPFGEPLLP